MSFSNRLHSPIRYSPLEKVGEEPPFCVNCWHEFRNWEDQFFDSCGNPICRKCHEAKKSLRRLCLLAIVLIIVLFFSSCSSSPWTRADMVRQTAVVGLMAADWHQTRVIATETVPGTNEFRWEEYNPILGKHPSRGEVDTYFVGLAVAHTAIAVALPPKWRKYWQYFYIGAEGFCVVHNFNEGIR